MKASIEAIVTALETKGNGAVENGRLRKVPRRSPRPRTPESSEVLTVQVAVRSWRCDTCDQSGIGGMGLLGHFNKTGHIRYSPRAPR